MTTETTGAKHTGGRWTFNEHSHAITTDLPAQDGLTIADLNEWTEEYHPELGNSAANGHLLAASPDMLAALRTVQDTIRLWRDGEVDEGAIEELKYVTVDTTIAKATGGAA